MHIDLRPHRRPVIEDLGFAGGHIDTAVAHGSAKVVVPIGAVNGIAAIELHDPRHAGQAITGAGHVLAAIFTVNPEAPGDRWGGRQPGTDVGV